MDFIYIHEVLMYAVENLNHLETEKIEYKVDWQHEVQIVLVCDGQMELKLLHENYLWIWWQTLNQVMVIICFSGFETIIVWGEIKLLHDE